MSNSLLATIHQAVQETTDGLTTASHPPGQEAAVAAGEKAALAKIAAIVGHDGIKGDAGRMAAAIDLAAKAPAMSADEVASFVTVNIGGGAGVAANYERGRMAALSDVPAPGGLVQPSGRLQASGSLADDMRRRHSKE